LRLDPAGPLTARVVLVSPSPGGLLLTVRIEFAGLAQAVGGADHVVAVGNTVRLRLDPAATAIVPLADKDRSAVGPAGQPVIVG
jgi:hypothetical protein